MPDPYAARDRERLVDEHAKREGRSAFQRDRARVLHSAALRRLAAKTQVHVAFASDFPRTRLTHSLECAQIGRELGAALGADPDLVDAACLAHDLGHPPFGHNGEAALDVAAASCGGFEGNAQSLRLLTRLEIKIVDASGATAGLNLTRATLDATMKYPWQRREGVRKFGVYDDDLPVAQWVRDGRDDERQTFEAQVMDWADDVAYSVHDLEDALHDGSLPFAALLDPDERAQLLTLCLRRYVTAWSGIDRDDLEQALDRLLALPAWPSDFDGGLQAHAGAKALTSLLIGRFCSGAELATREAFGGGRLTRYAADLVVPLDVRAECAVLKAVTARYVMERPGTEGRYARERGLVAELVDAVAAGAPHTLDPVHAAWFEAATDDAARLRVVIDRVAALTDTSALALHRHLCGSEAPA
jgi:dGTPase